MAGIFEVADRRGRKKARRRNRSLFWRQLHHRSMDLACLLWHAWLLQRYQYSRPFADLAEGRSPLSNFLRWFRKFRNHRVKQRYTSLKCMRRSERTWSEHLGGCRRASPLCEGQQNFGSALYHEYVHYSAQYDCRGRAG